MGNYLNPGNDLFRGHLKNKYYVDKSGLIASLNDCIFEDDKKYVCVTRPRRFGKSYAADMLTAYYSRGCDSHTLFEGAEISKSPDYESHINKFDVIYLDAAYLFDIWHVSGLTTLETIDKFQEILTGELAKAYPDVPRGDGSVADYLSDVYEFTNTPFVFVIDEWDALFRVAKDDTEGQKAYLRFLNDLLKLKKYVALAYMTGILPIKKYGSRSALDMFKEISMIDADPLREYTGFTEEDVKNLSRGDGKKEDDIKDWLGAYSVNGLRIYNPYAVVEALGSTEPLHGYWTATETYEALDVYFKTKKYGVRGDMVNLVNAVPVEVETGGFANDMTTLRGRNDVLTLLIHLGYLTMYTENGKKYVRIPNNEIRSQFLVSAEHLGIVNPEKITATSQGRSRRHILRRRKN